MQKIKSCATYSVRGTQIDGKLVDPGSLGNVKTFSVDHVVLVCIQCIDIDTCH